MTKEWMVGGDDVLHRWHVVRHCPHKPSAVEYIMNGKLVKYFSSHEAAQKVADRLNKNELRVGI